MKKALTIIGNLIHQFQKERGMQTLYLESSGDKYEKEVARQQKHTCEHLDVFKKECESWKASGYFKSSIMLKISLILKNIEHLDEYREKISELSIVSSKIINYYTYEIIAHLLDAVVEIAYFDKNTDPTKVTAYANFLYWKERAGRERAIGSRGFLLKIFSNKEFVERIESLIHEQESYKRTFLNLANEKQRLAFEEIMDNPSVEQVDKMNTQIEKLLDPDAIGEMSAEKWFELMTCKIDLMHQVELMLIEFLEKEEVSPHINKSPGSLTKQQYDFVCSLPFFSCFPDEILSDLLQHAQAKTYKKGKFLFLEGEHNTRFYIILNGWVKLFNGTEAGEEAILQMLSSGDILSESSVFLNSPHTFSSQIAEDAVLLSFPAPIIREYIRSNNEFAVNMLTNLSLRSQRLIHQVESTRLKSVDERVGWFLLKLTLNSDKYNGAVQLPYDKAMIASYLDMKPETLSRALKRFKEKGFKIENDTVIIPEITSLCVYCDVESKLQCSRDATNMCPNTAN